MCWYGIKRYKNVLCLIVVGLLDLRVCGQSDVMGAERRGVFGDLQVSRFLQSGEEESQCGGSMVSSFAYVSLPLNWSSGLPSFDLLRCHRICLLYCFSLLIKSHWVFFVILPQRSWIGRKITFNIFIFWQISLTFQYTLILCTETPFFHFEESLTTDNIQ